MAITRKLIGALQMISRYTVDNAGRVTKAAFYMAKNDTLQGQQLNTYNDHGFCESNMSYGKNNKLLVYADRIIHLR
jgi:hypothetical protein